MTALVKVYIPTYRRPHLLPRALASLLAQTHTDWIAEVINDDPADSGPAELVARLGDPRLTCTTKPRNLGSVATLNACYASGPEPFLALLEDDNAWEPRFLERLHAALSLHPHATLVWCNQALDEEQPDGTIRELALTVHPWPVNPEPTLHPFGNPAQAFGALHGNSAMLLRRSPVPGYLTPDIPLTGVESYRERLFPGPMLYLPEPLARFTNTRDTARTRDARPWASLQTALVATFACAAESSCAAELWHHARASQPPMTGLLIQAGLADSGSRHLLIAAHPSDWLRWLAGAIRYPFLAAAALRCARQPWWPELAAATRARFARTPLVDKPVSTR